MARDGATHSLSAAIEWPREISTRAIPSSLLQDLCSNAKQAAASTKLAHLRPRTTHPSPSNSSTPTKAAVHAA